MKMLSLTATAQKCRNSLPNEPIYVTNEPILRHHKRNTLKNNLSREGREECEGRNPRSKVANSEMYPKFPASVFASLRRDKRARTPSISDFRYTIYEPVGASHRHPRSGFPRQKEGTLKHAIFRNEAKFHESLFSIQVAVRQAIVRDFWSYFRKAILKNKANFSIYDFRLPICDCGEKSNCPKSKVQSRNLKQKSD